MLSTFYRRSLFVLVPFAAAAGFGFVGCGSGEQPFAEEGSETALRLAFPTLSARVLDEGEPLVPSLHGFVRAPEALRPVGSLSVELPQKGSQPIVLRAPSGLSVRVHQHDVEGEGKIVGHAVAYRRAGGTSFWTVGQHGAEEWIQLEAGVARADAPALSWEVEGGKLRQHEDLIEVLDEKANAHFRVMAPVAYGEGNREVPVRLEAREQRIELYVDAAEGEALLIDPVWTGTGSMTTSRVQHSMTLLQDGRVLVVGGKSGDSTVLGTAEIYDPATKTWTLVVPSIGSLTARCAHTATLLGDGTGRVLVAGGFPAASGAAALTSTQVYNPATNAWSSAGNLTARGSHGAVALASGGVMVAGGMSGNSGSSIRINGVQTFDPAAGKWSSASTNLSTSRQLPALAQLGDGSVIVVGGDTSSSPPGRAVDIYNPDNQQRLATTPLLNAGRSGHSAVLLPNGKLLVTNGATAGTSSGVGEVYDPGAKTWTNTGAMLGNRTGSPAILLDGKVLVAGGGPSAAGALASAELYDPATNAWSAAPSLLAPRRFFGAALLQDGRVLIAGGEGPSGILATAELYEDAAGAIGDSCTTGADCQSGFCVESLCAEEDLCAGVSCTALDQCHSAGVCDPMTGACSNPAKANGTACDDGNPATVNDVCTGGVCAGVNLCAGVICTAQDQCHSAGVCNPTTGACSNPAKANGTACDDGNPNTVNDVCTAGVCAGVGVDLCAGVSCDGTSECQKAGVCNPADGSCSYANEANGTPCSVGACLDGVCIEDQGPDGGVVDPDAGPIEDAGPEPEEPGDAAADGAEDEDAGPSLDPDAGEDASTDAGDLEDAGDDASTDAGEDADAPTDDAGDASSDEDASTDAGSTEDADAEDAGENPGPDAATDASTEDAAATDDAGFPGTGDPDADALAEEGGCGCRTAGGSTSTSGALAGLALAGAVMARRRRG